MLPDAADVVPDQDLLSTIAAKLGGGATPYEASSVSWHDYNPCVIWLILGAVGLASVAGMVALHWRSPARQ